MRIAPTTICWTPIRNPQGQAQGKEEEEEDDEDDDEDDEDAAAMGFVMKMAAAAGAGLGIFVVFTCQSDTELECGFEDTDAQIRCARLPFGNGAPEKESRRNAHAPAEVTK
jgi:hypothetical protein